LKNKKAADIQHLIEETDTTINAMVYQWYGLTEKEIKLVKGVK
jgi:hypothetical protein